MSINEVIGGSPLQAFITHLVGRERLMLANSKLSAAASAAMVVGPALVGPPLTVLVDAASFPISAALI